MEACGATRASLLRNLAAAEAYLCDREPKDMAWHRSTGIAHADGTAISALGLNLRAANCRRNRGDQ
jgi:cytolysin (calcineurin-like family phosphatase)